MKCATPGLMATASVASPRADESVDPSETEHMAQVVARFLRAYGTEARR
ncbi:hypothetical protein [Streptomyces sp. NPDC055400]